MNKRIQIPDTDLAVCPVGLGTVSAGIKWDGTDADKLIGTYLELGGNLIDTARVYSDWIPGETGRSERVVGDWIARSGRRNDIVLMTKGGHPRITEKGGDMHLSRMSDRDMREDLELSLKALGTETIDIYFYHRDDVSQPVEEEVETMERFVREGKIRYYACSNWTADRMKAADEYCAEKGYRGFVADQAMLNAGMRFMKPPADDTLVMLSGDVAEYHRNAPRNLAIAYSSLAGGFFQRWAKGQVTEDDPYNTPGNIMAAKALKRVAEKYNTGMTEAVLGYIVTGDYPRAALFGPGSASRVREAMAALEVPFRREDYRELE